MHGLHVTQKITGSMPGLAHRLTTGKGHSRQNRTTGQWLIFVFGHH
jgi:hypothetical protein